MKKSREQNNLFVEEEKQKNKDGAPLAEKLRPETLDEMIGQAALLGKGDLSVCYMKAASCIL